MAGSQDITARKAELFRNDGHTIELVLTKAGMQYIEPLTLEQARKLYGKLAVALTETEDDQARSFKALVLEGERPDADLHPSAVERELA